MSTHQGGHKVKVDGYSKKISGGANFTFKIAPAPMHFSLQKCRKILDFNPGDGLRRPSPHLTPLGAPGASLGTFGPSIDKCGVQQFLKLYYV